MYSLATSQEPRFSQKENKVRHPYWRSRNCRSSQVGSIVANMETCIPRCMIRTCKPMLYPIGVSDSSPLIWQPANCSCVKILMKVLHFWRAGVFLSIFTCNCECHTDNFRRSCIESSINFDPRIPTPSIRDI